jgi:hypothetical protein
MNRERSHRLHRGAIKTRAFLSQSLTKRLENRILFEDTNKSSLRVSHQLSVDGQNSFTGGNGPHCRSRINSCWLVHRLLLSSVSDFLLRPAGVCPARATGKRVPVCPTTNDQIDIPTAGYAADWVWAHPRPRPRGSSASKARLTTSLMGNPLAAANVRTRRTRLCGS